MNDCGAKSKLSGPLIISQKPGTTVVDIEQTNNERQITYETK
jgi:hypothetical protein